MSDLREIAILGFRRKLRDEVEKSVRGCLADGGIVTRQYHLNEPTHNPLPSGALAAFVIVDSSSAVISLQAVAGWGDNLPVVIVSDHPQYAMEGIRQQVRHYLLFPLTDVDMREALVRIGVEVQPGG